MMNNILTTKTCFIKDIVMRKIIKIILFIPFCIVSLILLYIDIIISLLRNIFTGKIQTKLFDYLVDSFHDVN